MKILIPFLILTIIFNPASSFAQKSKRQARIDSLTALLPKMPEDTNKIKLLQSLAAAYVQTNPEQAISFGEQGLQLSEKLHNKDAVSSISFFLGNISRRISDPQAALGHYATALNIERSKGDKEAMASIMTNIGATYQTLSNYPKALEYLFNALNAFEDVSKEAGKKENVGIKNGIANSLVNIANIYMTQKDYAKEVEYNKKAFAIYESFNYAPGMALIEGNIGDGYSRQKDYVNALTYVTKSLAMYRNLGDNTGIERNLSNLGSIALKQADYKNALEYTSSALNIARAKKYTDALGYDYSILGEIYLTLASDSTNDYKKTAGLNNSDLLVLAKNYTDSSIRILVQTGDVEALFNAYKQLSDIQQLNGDYKNAYTSYVMFKKLNDSVYNGENEKKLTQTSMNYEFAKKEDSLKLESEKKQLALQKEIELKALKYEYEKKQAAAKTEKEKQQLIFEQQLKEQKIENEYTQKIAKAEEEQRLKEQERKQREALAKVEQEKKDALGREELRRQRNILYSSLLGLAGLLIFSTVIFRQRNKVKREKKRSDELLLNILPSEVAEELKTKGSSDARSIDEVTVLFTDFKGFTQLSEKLTPKELVAEINECFSAFDHIMQKYGVEKIKTIGDSYMAAGGLPTPNKTHATDVVKAALDIQQFMQDHALKKTTEGKLYLDIRIGVHTGPVVAGIVGIKKFAYDIWGDTVNTASRMESSGEPGKVNISSTTYALVKDKFNCEHRGKISAKGKGDIDMYFVSRSR